MCFWRGSNFRRLGLFGSGFAGLGFHVGFATEPLQVSELISVALPSGHKFDRGKSDHGSGRPPAALKLILVDGQYPLLQEQSGQEP